MRRSDRLNENALTRELLALERDLQEFTSRQPVSIQSGVASYSDPTPDEWDFVATIGSDSETNTVRFTTVTVDFEGDGAQQFPNEVCYASLFINGTSLSDQPVLWTDGLYRWQDSNQRTVTLYKWGEAQPIYFSDPYRYRWLFTFESLKQVTVYFKAYPAGSSKGTLTVSRVTS